jgi:hypothetical protein
MANPMQIFGPLARITGHLFFWIMVYFFYTYFLGYGSIDTVYVNKFSWFLMPITIGISYFFVYYLMPKYLLKKRQGLFVLYSVYTVIIGTFLILLSILYGLVLLLDIQPENATPLTKTLPFIVLGVYFVVLIAIAISLIFYNYRSLVKNEDLQNKFLQTQLQLKEQELKFLKMQIHPHFLFNSLNTIYGFALKKREEAPEMILKLSNLLDYILYQIEKPYVLLENELLHLKDYMGLEAMRFHDTLEVEFENEFQGTNYTIAPMLLIPFVENAFKHGAIIDGVLKVNIKLYRVEDTMVFEVINSLKNKERNVGIGLENIKRRLEMLYKGAFVLEVDEVANEFIARLHLQIDVLNR